MLLSVFAAHTWWKVIQPGADFNCALQVSPVVQADGVEPAGYGECDDTLGEGMVECVRMFLLTSKELSFPRGYCCCWHRLRISSVLEGNFKVRKVTTIYLVFSTFTSREELSHNSTNSWTTDLW